MTLEASFFPVSGAVSLISKGLEGDTGEFLCQGEDSPSVLLRTKEFSTAKSSCGMMGQMNEAIQQSISCPAPIKDSFRSSAGKDLSSRVRQTVKSEGPGSFSVPAMPGNKWYRVYRRLFEERGIEVPPPKDAAHEQRRGWTKFRCWRARQLQDAGGQS
jgi:hypothetical protein